LNKAGLNVSLSAQPVQKPGRVSLWYGLGMTGCYIDESGTDSDLPVAVVAGLLLDGKGFFWLGQEWEKTLAQHHIPGPIHMREFGPHGRFNDLTHDARRALFADLVEAINDNKLMSVAGTLTAAQYRQTFKGISKLSMYAACFCNVWPAVSVWTNMASIVGHCHSRSTMATPTNSRLLRASRSSSKRFRESQKSASSLTTT